MLKHFFANLFYIFTVVAAAFGIFAVIFGIVHFIFWGGIWAMVILFLLSIVGIAYFCARKDYKEEQETKYKESYCAIENAFDNLFYVIKYCPKADYQQEMQAFMDAMEKHRELYGEDIHYKSYYERLLQLKQLGGLSD